MKPSTFQSSSTLLCPRKVRELLAFEEPKRPSTNRHSSQASLLFRSGMMVGIRVAAGPCDRLGVMFTNGDWFPPHHILSVQHSLAEHFHKVRPVVVVQVCETLWIRHTVLGSSTATGRTGTGAGETAWRQSKPVHPATLATPVRIPSGTMFVVQCVTHTD